MNLIFRSAQQLSSISCLITIIFLNMSISSAEENAPSFYGQRNVAPVTSDLKQPEISFQRRSLAPVIPAQPTNEKTPEKTLKAEHFSDDLSQHNATQLDLTHLTRNDWLLAKKAQYYINKNFQKKTGLWDSVQGYTHTTMWDVASGIGANLALEKLQLQSTEITIDNLTTTLKTLSTIPLYNQELPNREYNTKTGLPSGSYSKSTKNGNGWSALDIGRLLIWFKIMEQQHPILKADIDKVLNYWDLTRATHQGTLFGTKYSKGKEHYRQEGRLGYLQYCAIGYQLYGYDVKNSFQPAEHYQQVIIDERKTWIDTRNVPYFTSDPYAISAIELGASKAWWQQLDTVYKLHKDGWQRKDHLHAYAEDAMNKSPWFAYNNLFYYGQSWLSTTPSGKTVSNPQVFSNKVAMAFSVLYDDAFSKRLMNKVIENSLHSRSIPTGEYENGAKNIALNINTNSLVLVALWFKAQASTPIYSQRLTAPIKIDNKKTAVKVSSSDATTQ